MQLHLTTMRPSQKFGHLFWATEATALRGVHWQRLHIQERLEDSTGENKERETFTVSSNICTGTVILMSQSILTPYHLITLGGSRGVNLVGGILWHRAQSQRGLARATMRCLYQLLGLGFTACFAESLSNLLVPEFSEKRQPWSNRPMAATSRCGSQVAAVQREEPKSLVTIQHGQAWRWVRWVASLLSR